MTLNFAMFRASIEQSERVVDRHPGAC